MTITSIAFHNYYQHLNQHNAMFERVDTFANAHDELNWPMMALKEYAQARKITVGTFDSYAEAAHIDAYVFFDMPLAKDPVYLYACASGKPLFLVVWESKICKLPQSHDQQKYKYFRRVLTWDDDVVNGTTILKINYAFKRPPATSVPAESPRKSKMCALVAANKYSDDPHELYSERINAIRWFEKNHPCDFDLFGYDWNYYIFPGMFGKLNRFRWLRKMMPKQYPSYKGMVTAKRDVLRKYKYSICYENARGANGYITEKIFDCFFADCVPVYWGAENISQYIPENTYIDRRSFDDYSALYAFLATLSDAAYDGYLQNIRTFLRSDRFEPFSADYYAQLVVDTVVNAS